MDKLIDLTDFESFRPKLEHLQALLKEEIGYLNENSKIVIIAGTNGKGEVGHALNYQLHLLGHSTLFWTSPHVLTIQERIMNGHDFINYDALEKLLSEAQETIVENKLSFYEALFFIFVRYAKEVSPKYIILEVGLGGRFDATNIFKPALTLLTSISRDHTAILGKKLNKILFEKYGITRSGVPLLHNVEQDYLADLLRVWTDRDEIFLERIRNKKSDDYSQRNLNLAKRALSLLEGDGAVSLKGLPTTKGRRELMTFRDINFIFIGAHNLDGHRKLLESLRNDQKGKDFFALSFSTGREEQVKSILDLYGKYPCVVENLFLTTFEGRRAMSKEVMIQSGACETYFLQDWNDLINDKYKKRNIYICGSYFFIGEFQKFLFNSNT